MQTVTKVDFPAPVLAKLCKHARVRRGDGTVGEIDANWPNLVHVNARRVLRSAPFAERRNLERHVLVERRLVID